MNFDAWYQSLVSDTRWFELLRHYREETIRKAAQNVFAQLVADNTVDVRPMPENRKHVYNICIKGGNGDKVIKPWHVQEAEKNEAQKKAQEEEEWLPLTGEQRAQRLKEWEAIVKGSTMLNSMPKPSYKTLAEEGGVLPPKPAPYPCTSLREAYNKERHIAYLIHNYDPITRDPLPGFVDELTWNALYDEFNKPDNL